MTAQYSMLNSVKYHLNALIEPWNRYEKGSEKKVFKTKSSEAANPNHIC